MIQKGRVRLGGEAPGGNGGKQRARVLMVSGPLWRTNSSKSAIRLRLFWVDLLIVNGWIKSYYM